MRLCALGGDGAQRRRLSSCSLALASQVSSFVAVVVVAIVAAIVDAPVNEARAHTHTYEQFLARSLARCCDASASFTCCARELPFAWEEATRAAAAVLLSREADNSGGERLRLCRRIHWPGELQLSARGREKRTRSEQILKQEPIWCLFPNTTTHQTHPNDARPNGSSDLTSERRACD